MKHSLISNQIKLNNPELKIRLLKFEKELLIQEKTTKDEFIIRLMKTKKEAEDFIKQRLEIYDRMWDGCGCRVEYYV